MDLTERIERRRTRRSRNELIVDRDSLNPAVHPSKPVGREALFETLLNAIDPLFDRAVPPNTYVWGPGGAGKSATVTALLSALDAEIGGTEPLYTETLRERIDAAASKSETPPVAVDHVGEPTIVDLADLHAFFEPFGSLARIGVGRTPPGELSVPPAEQQLHVPAYPRELVDVLTVRGSRRLSHTLDHGHARRIAEWAGGDAHDALAALFIAAATAEADDAIRVRDADVDAGIAAIPTDGVPIGRVLTLSRNERQVVEQLLALSLDDEVRIEDAAERIAGQTDLTDATVKRLLYELAQFGVLERREVTVGTGSPAGNPAAWR